ncbi:MAG: NAD-dependent epimerase/dehydratase family protein [Flavobacteriaceae bacterium]|nr:NAD-dependent epimerase/dehydratase family protein [Flavobacteriaceae bacterium]
MTKILITGALGQIGSELSTALTKVYGPENVIITDIHDTNTSDLPLHYEKLDVNNEKAIQEIIEKHQINDVYHLAAMLSATAEKFPVKGWELNTHSLLYFLELARNKKIQKLFWPSSIAVFGRGAQKENTPQEDVKNPLTMYGIAKSAGEGFCEIYHKNYGVDVRSIRYPGLISWKTQPGGGTTDYAVDIYYKALEQGKYTGFLNAKSRLPMMYMDDAVRATIELMQAPAENILVRTAYNLQAISFNPEEIAYEIKKHIPNFQIDYQPDYRQQIADNWPYSTNDIQAREQWNWKEEFNLESMTIEMLNNLKNKLKLTNS